MSETVDKQKKYLFPAVTTYYKEALALERGEGMYVWDENGTRYLDCFAGVLTISVGHSNPAVIEAQTEQLKRLQHTSALYANKNQADLAEKLAEITPGDLTKSFFTNSGTEANDTAVLAAKLHTKRNELIVLRYGYAGRSATALSMMGNSNWRPISSQIPGISHAHAPYCYRCPFHMTYPSCDLKCATDIEEIIQTTTTGEIAAFMAETILGVGGFIVPPPGYFEKAVEISKKYGGLFICDEVQTGWGRTGEKWFGIQHWDVEPDILTTAKGMANGAPIGLTIARSEIADSFPSPTISTFGGNPVSMAAALATIGEIETKRLRENSAENGAYLRSRLEELKDKYSVIGDVRGMGLMQGIELVKDPQTKEPSAVAVSQVFEATKENRVLIGRGGLHGNVIRLGPPLIANKSHIDELVEALDSAFATVVL